MKPKFPDPTIAPIQAQIYAALAANPLAGLTMREIMTLLGLSYDSVSNALQRLRANGRIEHDRARHLWRPKSARDPASAPDPWRSTLAVTPNKPLEKGVTPEDLEWMRAQLARAAARAARATPYIDSRQ